MLAVLVELERQRARRVVWRWQDHALEGDDWRQGLGVRERDDQLNGRVGWLYVARSFSGIMACDVYTACVAHEMRKSSSKVLRANRFGSAGGRLQVCQILFLPRRRRYPCRSFARTGRLSLVGRPRLHPPNLACDTMKHLKLARRARSAQSQPVAFR